MVRRDWYDKLTLIISFITVIVLIAGLLVVNEFNINLKELRADSLRTENLTAQKVIITNEAGNQSACIFANDTYSFIIDTKCP